MTDRTEEQKVVQETLKIPLGEKIEEVRLLTIKEARAWRVRVAEALAQVPALASVDAKDPEKFKAGVDGIFSTIPDLVLDLFFDYARDLDRDAIEEVATDSQLALGFAQVAEVAFPLVSGLVGTMGKLSQ